MSNEIINKEFAAPSLVEEDVQAGSMIIPRLALLQGQSNPVKAKQAEAGTWHNEILSENYGATIEVIPAIVKYGAILFERGKGMVCKSEDGLTSIFGDACKQCPHAAYHLGPWQGKNPPKCSSTIDMVVMEKNSGIPMILTFKVSTYKVGKLITTNMKLRKACSVTLGATMAGDNYMPVIKGYKSLTPDEYKAAAELREQLRNVKYSAGDEPVETTVVDASPEAEQSIDDLF